jgi:type IV pilus assembly protein PilC
MAETLERLAGTLERRQALWNRLRRALTYPFWVLTLGLVLNLAMARSLLPAFSRSFAEAGVPLPAFSRIVLQVTLTAGDPQTWLVLVALVGLAWVGSRSRDPGLLLDRLPVVGPLRLRAGRIEVLYTLAALLESGIPMQKALTGTLEAATAPTLRADLEAIRGQVLDGQPLSQALAGHGFSLMAVQFARAAEQSGDYPTLLRQVADSQAQNQELALEATTRLLEPILVALMGLVIGTVSVALFIPLYSAAAAW